MHSSCRTWCKSCSYLTHNCHYLLFHYYFEMYEIYVLLHTLEHYPSLHCSTNPRRTATFYIRSFICVFHPEDLPDSSFHFSVVLQSFFQPSILSGTLLSEQIQCRQFKAQFQKPLLLLRSLSQQPLQTDLSPDNTP